jgi:serine/threonine-protein kinase
MHPSVPYLMTGIGGFALAYAIVAIFIFPPQPALASDVKVPNLVGESYSSASKELEALGLKVEKGLQRYDPNASSGTVLRQSPPANSVATKGESITLDVSLGERRARVPAVVGITRERARLAIENAALEVGTVSEVKDPAPRGQVLSSDPASGATVPVPSEVNLTVSAGPDSIGMPDVTGQSFSEARALLAQLGLVVGQAVYDPTSPLPQNTVISQSPAANSPIAAGSTVSLTIAGYSQPRYPSP